MMLRHVSAAALALTLLIAGVARAEKVSIEIPYVRAIQTFAVGENQTDDAYLLVTGVAQGKEVASRIPEGKTWKASPKTPPVTDKKPVTVWSGDLAEGQFVFLNVTVMQGKTLTEAQAKAYRAKLAEVVGPAKAAKSLDRDGAKELVKASNKSHNKLASGIKKVFSRELKTDHYNGSFNILVYNDGGKVRKRVDVAGLAFGEHYGIGVKQYAKIKYTRENVLYQDPNGQWYEHQLGPTNDDEDVVRIKLLETEKIKVAGKDEPVRNVTDYLIDLKVTVGGKAKTWTLGGEEPGPTILHDYWMYAE